MTQCEDDVILTTCFAASRREHQSVGAPLAARINKIEDKNKLQISLLFIFLRYSTRIYFTHMLNKKQLKNNYKIIDFLADFFTRRGSFNRPAYNGAKSLERAPTNYCA